VLSFDNPLVGILHHKRDTSFNFVMLNGDMTTYPCNDLALEETRVPDHAIIKFIRIRELNELVNLSPQKK
jgi:hypothetical protein